MSEAIRERNEKLRLQMLSAADPKTWEHTETIVRESTARYAEDPRLARIDTVCLIGHGTSLATAMNAEFLFTKLAGVSARAVPAYQFRTYPQEYLSRPENTLVVGVSCSGNTASVVKGLEEAKALGAMTLCVSGSGDIKMAPPADFRVTAYTEIESENGMTAYSLSHLFILQGAMEFALLLGEKRGVISPEDRAYWNGQWEDTKAGMQALPALFDAMDEVVTDYREHHFHNLTVLGTGPNLGTAQEGALKICEFAWIFGACEELEDFAHGRFREVDGNIPLFMVAPHRNTIEKVLDLLAGCEVARTKTYLISEEDTPEIHQFNVKLIQMPAVKEECLTPFLYIFPLWFFGFHYRNRQQELVGERRFGLLAADISYDKYCKRK